MLESALKYCKEKAIDLLAGFVPKTYSMAQECNILGLYDDTFIITKQENLVGIISLQGLSYSNLMQKDLEGYFDTRQNVLNTISKDIQLRIVAKRRKEFINQSPNIDNIYAKAIITQFESKEIYKTEYFLVFETITFNVKSFFEKKKLEMTTSINEELEESSKEDKQENENSSNETHSNTSSKKDKKNKFKKKITFSATSKEFFNELRSEFAYRLNDHLLSEEYLYVNEPKLKELDNIKQQLQDLEKEEKALEQIKSPQDEWDLNKALQSEYLQELKCENKAKALDIQNNHSTPLKQKISEFKIALFNHKDTSDDEKEQLDIDRIDKRKPVSGHLKNTNKHELYELLGFYQKELDKKQNHSAFKNFAILNSLDRDFERETKGYSVLKKKEMLLNKLEHLDKRLLDKNSHLLLAQLRNEVKTKQNTQYNTLTNPIFLAKALELSKDKRPTLKTFKSAYFSARKYQFMLESFKTKQNDPTYKLNDNTYELVSKQLQDYQNTMLLLAKERLLFLEQDLKQKKKKSLKEPKNIM